MTISGLLIKNNILQIMSQIKHILLGNFKRHHIAIGIAETVDELDIREEAIMTLLCYLQTAKYIKIESNCYRYVTLRSYKGLDYLRDLAKGSKFLQHVMACGSQVLQQQPNSPEIKLDVMELCNRTRLTYPVVRQKLKSLEWGAGNKKSGISSEFSGYSFYVRRDCVRDLDLLDDINDLLWNEVTTHNEFAYANFKVWVFFVCFFVVYELS